MTRRQYTVLWTARARDALAAIPDRRIQKIIFERARELSAEPAKQGKPLIGELAGYRSLRAAGQRYRIIFRVDGDRVLVLIVALGIRKAGSRKDVYDLARKLVRLGLVEPRHRKPK
ncbi:MAG: type II toxin-antitoxin system RelE family toxin [Thermoleophilia bacterium]